MAEVLYGSWLGDTVQVFIDVDNRDFVTGLRIENAFTNAVTLSVSRRNGAFYSQQVAAASSFSMPIPRNGRFRYSDELTSDYSVGLIVHWS